MESVKFEVISWYHDFPPNFVPLHINEPIFGAIVLNSMDKKPIGFSITWGFMVMNNKVTAINFVAKDDIISKPPELVKDLRLHDMQAVVRLSHLRYRKEFDKIKIGFGLDFIIPHYREADINYQDLLNLLLR